MDKRRAVIAGVIFAVVVAVFMNMSGRVIHAQTSETPEQMILAKLDMVLNSQKSIIESLASIKEDIGILTVRVTQNQ